MSAVANSQISQKPRKSTAVVAAEIAYRRSKMHSENPRLISRGHYDEDPATFDNGMSSLRGFHGYRVTDTTDTEVLQSDYVNRKTDALWTPPLYEGTASIPSSYRKLKKSKSWATLTSRLGLGDERGTHSQGSHLQRRSVRSLRPSDGSHDAYVRTWMTRQVEKILKTPRKALLRLKDSTSQAKPVNRWMVGGDESADLHAGKITSPRSSVVEPKLRRKCTSLFRISSQLAIRASRQQTKLCETRSRPGTSFPVRAENELLCESKDEVRSKTQQLSPSNGVCNAEFLPSQLASKEDLCGIQSRITSWTDSWENSSIAQSAPKSRPFALNYGPEIQLQGLSRSRQGMSGDQSHSTCFKSSVVKQSSLYETLPDLHHTQCALEPPSRKTVAENNKRKSISHRLEPHHTSQENCLSTTEEMTSASGEMEFVPNHMDYRKGSILALTPPRHMESAKRQVPAKLRRNLVLKPDHVCSAQPFPATPEMEVNLNELLSGLERPASIDTSSSCSISGALDDQLGLMWHDGVEADGCFHLSEPRSVICAQDGSFPKTHSPKPSDRYLQQLRPTLLIRPFTRSTEIDSVSPHSYVEYRSLDVELGQDQGHDAELDSEQPSLENKFAEDDCSSRVLPSLRERIGNVSVKGKPNHSPLVSEAHAATSEYMAVRDHIETKLGGDWAVSEGTAMQLPEHNQENVDTTSQVVVGSNISRKPGSPGLSDTSSCSEYSLDSDVSTPDEAIPDLIRGASHCSHRTHVSAAGIAFI